MNFTKASKVREAVKSMQQAGIYGATNRAKINSLFNGDPPWGEDEMEENNRWVNVNFLEAPRIAHNAREQLNNLFLKPGNFFNVKIDMGPPWKRDYWGEVITTNINCALQYGIEFNDLIQATNAQTVLHGIGPCYWPRRKSPLPREVGIDEVLVPKGTYISMCNLPFFAIYQEWTYPELSSMVSGKNVDPGWNKPYAQSVLKNLKNQESLGSRTFGRVDMPEKSAEDDKEGYSDGGAAPNVCAWEFYSRRTDEEDEYDAEWDRRIVVDYEKTSVDFSDDSGHRDAFLYDSSKKKEVYATHHSQIIHWQFGNVSNVAPFRYYSVRSLGWLLYAVGRLQNMMRSRFSERQFSEMLELFRNVPEADREKLEFVELRDKGIIPEGLNFVTAAERHQVNENLILLGLNQNRQLMAESSATYVPDVAQQSAQAQSATESMIRMQTSMSLNSAMANQAYGRIKYLYKEICRRFTIKDSQNKTVVKFRLKCLASGVPQEVLTNYEVWEVEPERMLGGGHKAMEVLQANQLMSIRPNLDPEAQRTVDRKFIAANSDDPRLAMELVPEEKPISDSTVFANLAFGVLMQGAPVVSKKGINEPDYIETLLQLMGGTVQALPQLADPSMAPALAQRIGGLINTSTHLEQHINQLAQNPSERQKAKQYQEGMAQIIAQARPFHDQLQAHMEQQQQSNQIPPEQMAKIQATMMKAQTDAQIQEGKAQQKQQHKDVAFQSENERRNAMTAADIHRKDAASLIELRNKDAAAKMDIVNNAQKASVDAATKLANSNSKPSPFRKAK
jgi:hypothetical protein